MQETAVYRRKYENTVYGSLAYDLAAEEFFPEGSYAEQEVISRPETEENAQVQALPRVRQSVAPTALVGFACAAVMLVFSLMAQVQLTAVSNETVRLQSQLSELQVEQVRLLISYESAFNLTEIEEYAIEKLGMQKPRNDQVFYVEGAASDKAVILQETDNGNGLMDRFSDMIASLGDFLG